MCGIAGFFSPSLSRDEFLPTIKRMLTYIKHRGPDEAGCYLGDSIAMGTVRLSIIDLESGSQPLSDASDRYQICYNGELYNYIELRNELIEKGREFSTSSDTEVVLQAWIEWGSDCLARFNGAFSFSIYDTEEDTLFLARDRFGKRPLFYSQRNGDFLFASEMKAFFGFSGFSFEHDPQQLAAISAHWTPLPDQTGFKNVLQLPMGEFLCVRKGHVSRCSYETLDLSSKEFSGTFDDALECVRERLSQSVKLRLRSDVEVRVYLSGGLDSAIVADLAARTSSHPLSTFSVQFEDQKFDESHEQNLLADFFGTCHTALKISAEDITSNFPAAIYHAEVPAFRTAFVPMYLLSERVNQSGIKVILCGEGADEAFLGYNIFKDTMLREGWDTSSIEEKRDKLSKMYPYLDHFDSKNQVHLMGLYQQFSQEQMPGLFSHEMRFQNGKFSARMFNDKTDPFLSLRGLVERDSSFSALSAVQKAQWLEFKTLLAGYLLSTQGERMSLAHSVENRCPFLDPDVVALSSSINLRFDDGFREKHLLREAFKDRLPAEITNQSKHPYRAPDSAAFVSSRPEYLELIQSDDNLGEMEFLNAKFCQALTKKIFSRDPKEISTKENQAFIFLVSLTLLNQFYIKKTDLLSVSTSDIDKIMVKEIDARKVHG